jgi:hypothetical protein
VLGDPDGVLTGDDTGVEKKGSCSAGVQRQYTGTAGKITNCQLGVFLAYAGPRGRALTGRELYLPHSWTGDEARLAAAGVPQGTAFQTKPQLLRLMIERAVAAGIAFRWVTADEAYGDNGPLRAFLEEQKTAYVLAVARDHVITTPAGRRRADGLAVTLPKGAWQRISCGNGAKGRRWYDWALVATSRPEISLLIRRSTVRPSELAFYRCHTPQPVPLAGRTRRPSAARADSGKQADNLSQRDPPAVHRSLRTAARRETRSPLVTMAAPPPRTRPPLPLPATTPARSLSAAGSTRLGQETGLITTSGGRRSIRPPSHTRRAHAPG